MAKNHASPKLIHDVKSYEIVQKRSFSIPIAEIFEPKDGSLEFTLRTKTPNWLHVDKRAGILHGIAPIVPYSKAFHITIIVKNAFGLLNRDLILKVIDTDVVENMSQTLECILTARKQDYGYSHLQSQLREILEYIYAFYSQDTYQALFEESLRKAAAERDVKLGKSITYYDFKSLMHEINSNLENELKNVVDNSELLTNTTLSNHELSNLFRQGSQATGTITIPVWNHFGSINLHNWSDFGPVANVLDAATDSIEKLKKNHAPTNSKSAKH